MLCSSCRRALLRRSLRSAGNSSIPPQLWQARSRTVATVPGTSNAAPSTPPPSTARDKDDPPPATSKPGIAQPFSTPFFPAESAEGSQGKTRTAKAQEQAMVDEESPMQVRAGSTKPSAASPKRLTSSVAGGAELKGLGYLKAKPMVYAKEDDEYPSWLWTLGMERGSLANATASDGNDASASVDVTSMTKKQRTRYERKQAKLMVGLEKPIPLHEQSKDLTGQGDDAVTSLQRRHELTKSLRVARRKDIREDNFLRTM